MRIEVSSIKDLPDLHRMGHTCANLNGDLFFIWGGSDESTAYLAARNNHLRIYETLTGYWRHRTCSGECPPYLTGSTSALIGQKMYVFGGHSSVQDNWIDGLYCLNLETFAWKDLSQLSIGEPTKPIRSDKCVSWSYDGRFYIFGGYGWSQTEHYSQLLDKQKDLQLTPDFRWPKFGWNNQLVEFNPQDMTWRWPSYSGQCPTARAAHSGAIVGDTYYLFGGRDSHERLNDLYALNMKTFVWTRIENFSIPNSIKGNNIIMPSSIAPIRHLLEDQDDGEDANEQFYVEDYYQEDDLRMEDAIEEEQQQQQQQEVVTSNQNDRDLEQDEEKFTPTPSSSSMQHNEQDATTEDNNIDRADLFEYPHPSHLLERWSLSSTSEQQQQHPPASSVTNHHLLEEDACATAHHNNLDESYIDVEDNQARPFCNYHQQQNVQVRNADSLPDNEQGEDDGDDDDENDDMIVQQENEPIMNIEQQRPPTIDESNANNNNNNNNQFINSQGNNEIPMPKGRSFASFTQISDQDIMLYGGISSQDENLHDCWIFNIRLNTWTKVDLKTKPYPRLWHTGARSKKNEVIIIGGSSSNEINDFCTDVLTISLEPKTLKRLALDSIARSIRMRTIIKVDGLPSTVCKLIKLRKQAMALTTIRRNNNRFPSSIT